MKYTPLYNLIIRGYHKSWVIIRVSIYKPRGVALASLPTPRLRAVRVYLPPYPSSFFVRIFIHPPNPRPADPFSNAILSFFNHWRGWSRPKDLSRVSTYMRVTAFHPPVCQVERERE